jgi:hypothetical protein
MRAIPGLGEEKLNEICGDFCSLGYPAGEREIRFRRLSPVAVLIRLSNYCSGCIQLPIEKAERIDPDHIAFSYYLDGRKQEDGRRTNYEDRLKYYLLALSTLEKYDNDAAQQGPGKKTRDGLCRKQPLS